VARKPKTETDSPDIAPADLEAVRFNPVVTAEMMAQARPLAEVLPGLAAAHRRRGVQKSPTKTLVSLRLDADVLERWRSTGPGWQSRINAALRKVKVG
jgi:uncharacterized protein (DUF4415 family)